MSISLRRSPQASKVLAIEAKSVASCAKTVQLRLRTHRSRVIPLNDMSSTHVVIHMIHDAGGAKAPMLIWEGTTGGP
jgi:hypothetical protein